MPSIKVLAISPYPGMVPLLTETGQAAETIRFAAGHRDRHHRVRRPVHASARQHSRGAGGHCGIFQHHTGYGHPADAAAIPAGRIYHTILQPGRYHAAIPAAGGICLGPVRYGHLHRRQGDGRQRFPYHLQRRKHPRRVRPGCFFLQRQPPAAQRKPVPAPAPAQTHQPDRSIHPCGQAGFFHAGGRLRRAAGHAARKNRERGRRGTHQGHAAVPRAAVQH